MLDAIGKEIIEGIRENKHRHYQKYRIDQILSSVNDAIKCMHYLNTFIFRYKAEFEYKDGIRRLADRIVGMKDISKLESDYGRLMFEGPMMFKKRNYNDYMENAYLICFQFRILVLEIGIEQGSWSNSALIDAYYYVASIKVSDKMTVAEDKANKQEGIIRVVTYNKDFTLNYQKRFDVKVNLGQELIQLKQKFESLIGKVTPNLTGEHMSHEFIPYISNDIDISKPKAPPSCGKCNHYLVGLFMGYKCVECDGYYCEQCFINGETESEVYGKI